MNWHVPRWRRRFPGSGVVGKGDEDEGAGVKRGGQGAEEGGEGFFTRSGSCGGGHSFDWYSG